MFIRADEMTKEPRSTDRGFTLVEIVVAIAILGIAATSILAALVSGIGGSARHREHATATAWLQSAADHLELTPRQACGTGTPADVAGVYQDDIRDEVPNSDSWAPGQISVTGVQFWSGNGFAAACSDGLQLVTLSVTSPAREITQTLDVIKGDPMLELSDPSGSSDPFVTCTLGGVTFSASKADAVVNGSPPLLKLKKPSATKPSKLKEDKILISVTVTGNCSGKLQITYQWPHYNKNGTIKHYHKRTIKLKLLNGRDGLTYTGKVGHHGDKFVAGASLNWTLKQGRTKSKTWGTVNNGVFPVRYG